MAAQAELPLLTVNQAAGVVEGDAKEDADHVDAPLDKVEVGLKRKIDLFSLVAYLIGSIIGSGIFASPRFVAIHSGSSGVMMLIWLACGVIAFCGALTWCELAVTFPNLSGGDYSYIHEAFGPFPAFIALYILFISRACSQSLIAIVAGDYVMTAIVGHGDSEFTKVIAAAVIVINMSVNCFSVTLGKRVQVGFTIAKMIAIVMLIVTGLVRIGQGHTENLENAFNGSANSVSDIAFALYGGLYAYAGWNSMMYMAAEIIDPVRTVPIAVAIAIPLVIVCYLLVNVAYLTVKSPLEIASSSAIAVIIGKDLYGVMHWTIPALVGCSCFSTVNASSFYLGRIVYEAANRKQFPKILGTIHNKRNTPIPALIFTACVALLILVPEASNFRSLLSFLSSMDWAKMAAVVAALLWMRKSKPSLKRPFKVFVFIPIIMFVFSVFVVVAPFFRYPLRQSYGLCAVLPAIPIYFAFIKYQVIPQVVIDRLDKVMKRMQTFGNLRLPDFEKVKSAEYN